MSFSLGHTEMVLLKIANSKGVVLGGDTCAVMQLCDQGFLECVRGPMIGAAFNEYVLTDKGRDTVAIHILLGRSPDCAVKPRIGPTR